MLLERTKDLWRPALLDPFLLEDRDKQLVERPRWVEVEGERIPVFHASEANACRRRLGYAYRGDVPLPNDWEGALRLHDGDPHADASVFWLEKMGFKVTDREKAFKRLVRSKAGIFGVIGAVDGFLHVPNAEGPDFAPSVYILEHKGLSTFTVNPKYRKSIDEIVNKGYRFQAQIYMWLSKCPRTMFVVKDKNTSQPRFFELAYNPKVIETCIARWSAVLAALRKKTLMDRDFTHDSLECKWCRHTTTCWRTPDE